MSYKFGMFTRLNVFTYTLLLLFSAAASTCTQISLTWSTVPWYIRHDRLQNQEIIAPLPPFNQTAESSALECNLESIIFICKGCDEDMYFDKELRALRIRTPSHLRTAQVSGEITAFWPDGLQAADMLSFYFDSVFGHYKTSDQQIFPIQSGTGLFSGDRSAEGQQKSPDDGLEVTRKRKLSTSATTTWWPTQTTVDLIDPSTMSATQTYTIATTTKTFSVSYFTISPSSMSGHFTRSYTVTQDDGTALPSWITWTNSGTDLDFTVYTADNTKQGTYTIKITATAIPNKLYQLQSTATSKWLKAYGIYNLKVDVDTPGDDLGTVWEVPYDDFLTSKWTMANLGLDRWLCVEYGGNRDAICDRSGSPGSWETFTIASLGTNTISMKLLNYGYYLGIDGTTTSTLKATATTVSSSQTWYYNDRTVDTITESATFSMVMNVGCSPTVYDSTSSATKVVYFVSGKSKVVTQPFVSDSVNNVYGTSTTSSICGTTSVTLTEGWGYSSSIGTASTSTGVPVLTFFTSQTTYSNTHSITVKYQLSSYSSIYTTYTMVVYACNLANSNTADQSYTVFKTALTFYTSYFTISPTAASSQFDITYAVTQSNGATVPSWLTMTDTGTNLKFTVYSTTNSDRGQYTILLTGTATLDDGQFDTDSDTFMITIYDGCPYTTYTSSTPTDWVSSVTYYVGATQVVVTQPWIDDSINESFGTSSTSSICGTTSAQAQEGWGYQSDIATVSTTTGVPVITFVSSYNTGASTRTVNIFQYLTSYTGVKKYIPMTVYVCKMTPSSVSAQTYTIFKTAVTFSAAYYSISPTAAASDFVITYTVTKSDGTAKPSWLTWTDSGTDHDFSIYSTDNTDKGTYTMKLTGTVKQDGVVVDTLSNTWTITLYDGCPYTTYVTGTPTDWVSEYYYYLGDTGKTVTQPFISDTINESFGTSSTSSVCGTTSAQLLEGYGYISAIATVSTSSGVPVITFTATGTGSIGYHSVTVKYYLTSYSSISKSVIMAVYVCQMYVSATTAQTYTIFKTAKTFSIAYFTISPSTATSQFDITYTVTKSDGSAMPSWLTWTDSGTDHDFSIYSIDNSNKGSYTMKLTGTATQDGVVVDTLSTTWTITLVDGCSATTFVAGTPADWESPVYYYLGATLKTISQSWVDDTINQSFGTSSTSSICGTQTYAIADSSGYNQNYATLDSTAGFPKIKIYTITAGYVGTRTLNVYYYLSATGWSISKTLSMIVYISNMVAPSVTDQTYTIFKTALTFSQPYFYITPTATASQFTITHVITQSSGSTIPSWLTFTDSGTDLDFSIYSIDNTDKGTYTIKITATATQDSVQVDDMSTTFKITLNDGCSGTIYDAIPASAITTVYYYLSNTKTVTQPFISDSANNLGGTSTTSSMCGTTSVTLSETNSWSTSNWVTASTSAGYPVLSIYTTSSSYVGTRTLKIKYYLTSWTSTTTTFDMTAYICQLVAPSISAKTFSVFKPASTFTVKHFTISPSAAESQFTIAHTIIKSDGSTIPSWLTYVDSNGVFTFTVATDDCGFSDVGTYNFKITATATLSDGQTGSLSTTFTINLRDPCLDTEYDSPDSALKEWVYYIGATVDLAQPFLSDSVNNLYGQNPLESICGPTTVTASDVWCEPNISDPMASGSVATYIPTLTFETFNAAWVGCHTLQVTYVLSRYTSVTTTYKIVPMCLCLLDPPTIEDQSYIIFSGQKTFSTPYFTIMPSAKQSDFTITYPTVTQSDGSALWSWLTWTDSGSALVFTVQNSVYSDAGTYTVKITAKAVKNNNDGNMGTMPTTFKIILIDPCKANPTQYVNDGTSIASASFLLGTTISVTQPWFSDTVNNLYGTGTSVSLCYTTTASVWENGSAPAYATLSNSLITPQLTFTTSRSSYVNAHSITIKYTLDRYTTVSYSLPMTVYICTLVKPTIPTKYYTIFSGDYTFTVPYFTIFPSSQQSLYTRTHVATQLDGTALWNWLIFEDSGSELLSFTANSTTYSDDNTPYTVTGQQYTVQITSTATMSDGQTQTMSTTFIIVMIDPCKNTILIPQTIPDQWQFIGAQHKPLAVKMPLITDTINKRYGTDPLNSICFTQFIKSKEGDFQTPNFVNLTIQKTGVLYTTMYVSEKDNDLFGPHVVEFTYTLDRYPHIQTTKSATITLIKVTPPPQPDDYIYYVNQDTLGFTVDMMQVEPYSTDIKFTYKVVQVGGTAKPTFLTYSEDSSALQDLNFEIDTSDSDDVGRYYIQINCTATHTNNQTASEVVKFWVTVKTNVSDQTVTIKAPIWTAKVANPLLATVGQPLTYTLPPAVSPVGNTFRIDVDLGAADKFVSYENGTFKVGNTTNQQVGTYPVKVTITDSKGAKTITTMNIVVRAPPLVQALIVPTKWSNETFQVQKTLSKLEQADSLNVSGWSFTDAFLQAKANGAKSPTPLKPPSVTFSDISRTAELVLTFSKDMIVPPLPKLQNVTVYNETSSNTRLLRIRRLQDTSGNDTSKYCGKAHPKVISESGYVNESDFTYECAPAQPKVVPGGDETEEDQLGYSFKVISQTARQMRMQLLFENPLKVSTNPDEPDWCEIHFLGNYFFFDKDGMTIPEDTIVRRRIPVLIPIEGITYQMMSAGVYATAAAQAAMVCCFFIFICMARPLLRLLWSMIRTWQIILMLPLFNLQMPGNAAIFFPFLWQIASFDFIPTDQFYNDVLGWNPTDSVSQNFEENGFGSQLFLYNIGSIMIAIVLYPLLIGLYLFLSCCCSKKPQQHWGQRTKRALSECLFWTYPLVVLFMAFIVFVISTFINYKFIMWDGTAQQPISAMFTIIFMIVVICMPVVLSVFMVFNWKRLQETSFQSKWFACYNSLFEPIDQINGRWVILEPVTFLVRRLCLAAVALYTKKLIYQCMVMIAFCIWQIFFVSIVRPFKNNFYHQMEIFSECVIMMEVYCFMMFSDYLKNVDRKYEIGYIACALIFFHFFVLVGLLIYQSVCEWRETVIEQREKQAQVKRQQNTLAAKLAIKLKQYEVAITPQKQKKVVEMSLVPDLERLEEIQEVIASQEESRRQSRHSTVSVVADENQNYAVALTDRTEDKIQLEIRQTAFNVSLSQTINEWEFSEKETVLPPHPPPFVVQQNQVAPPPVEEKKDDQVETTSQMNQRLKRVLITKEMQKQIKLDVSLDSIDDAFRFKKTKK